MKCKLSDIAIVTMGQSPRGSSYNANKDGKPFLQGRKTFGRIYPYIDTWTTEPNRMAQKGSILMSVRAPVGDVNIANNEICIGRGLCSINAKNGNNNYLYYLLLNSKANIVNKSSGTVFDSINRNQLENLEVNAHNEEEQRKISKILSKIDEKIELNTHTNNNLYEIANNLLLNDFEENKETEILSNIIKFTKGKKPLNISNKKEKDYIEYLTIACLNNQEITYANIEKTITSNKDILMVMDGASSGEVYFSNYGIVGSTLARVDIINEDYIKEYIFFVLKKYSEIIKNKNTGSAIPHTDKAFVNTLELPIISIEKQFKYKNILEKIQQNNTEVVNLIHIRDTLLPKLMNGEIDLDKIEI